MEFTRVFHSWESLQMSGCWGFGEWECSPVSQSDRGSMEKGFEDLLSGRGVTSSGFCCVWCLYNSCMRCFLLAELPLPSVPGLFSIISIIWHFIFRLDFHGWDSIIKRVRSIRMNMVFLLLFQTYRFPRIQQGTGNQGALCITVQLLLPPPLTPGKLFVLFCFFQDMPSFCNNFVLEKHDSFSRSFSLLLAHRRKPFCMMAWNVF